MSIGKKALKGTFWSICESWGNRFSSVIVFYLLARLLGPEDFGLAATAAVYVGFIGIFIDQGFTQAIIQRKEVNQAYLDTAFYINVLLSALLFAINFALAPVIASLLGENELTSVIRCLSLGLLFGGASKVQEAMLTKEFAFRALSIRSLLSSFLSGIVGVTMAMLGFGVWSLVAKEVVFSLVRALTVWMLRVWSPTVSFSKEYATQLFSFGSNMLGARLLNYFYRRSDDFLIGYFLGPVALGIYTVGYRLLLILTDLFIGVIQKVALPVFSELQGDLRRLSSAFLKATKITANICFPLFISMSILAPQIVNVLFGKEWQDSIPVMRVLPFAGLIHSITYFDGSALIAIGRTGDLLKFRLIQTFITVSCMAAGLQYGITGVAVAFVVGSCLSAPISVLSVLRNLKIEVSSYISRYNCPLISTFPIVLLLLTITHFVSSSSKQSTEFVFLAACCILAMLIYIITLSTIDIQARKVLLKVFKKVSLFKTH